MRLNSDEVMHIRRLGSGQDCISERKSTERNVNKTNGQLHHTLVMFLEQTDLCIDRMVIFGLCGF